MSCLHWTFPLPRPYTGILLGNGTLGLMVWGTDRICLSISRNGFWDRRGGIPFASEIDFKMVHELLEADRMEELKAAFATKSENPLPFRTPTQLPGGRLELTFPSVPRTAALDTTSGRLTVNLADGSTVEIRLDPVKETAWVGGSATPREIKLRPAWEWIGETLAPGEVAEPTSWTEPGGGGFCQTLPADDALHIEWRRTTDGLLLTTRLGDAPVPPVSPDELHRNADKWWADYTRSVPRVSLPDPVLQRAWDYGVFKQAGMTPPHGVPATLQGPWMAEDGLPPWSNDFHFNINLQMIYWPALPTNRANHLAPIWKLIHGWLPRLRENAAAFFKNPRALMLPHAVDDRCQVIGNFWQGTIDQACTAWMAQIAWLHYRHTLDESILRETAWPLLTGAFEGFWAMLEERDGRLSLPVSVSAEFGTWGHNASFQLAALHMLADLLPRAASILGEPADPRWEKVRTCLPAFSSMPLAKVWGDPAPHPRIVLWEGQDLPESHRHHSHLAGIYPFRTIDPKAERDLVRRSMEHWAATGPGQWVGWSMPWAAILWARCDYASAAVSLLRIWDDVFTNKGHQTLHNADSPGYSSWIHGPFFDWPDTTRHDDQMQMDAGFGVLQAIAEIFLQQRGDVLHVLPSLPKQWRDISFDGILCEGAFLAAATVTDGHLAEVRITSQLGGLLRVAFPVPLDHAGDTADSFTLETTHGECLVFKRSV